MGWNGCKRSKSPQVRLSRPDLSCCVSLTSLILGRYNNDPAVAARIVAELAGKSPVAMRIQRELVEEGKRLVDTDAGAFVHEEILRLQKQHEEDLAVLKKEMEQATRSSPSRLQSRFAWNFR